jgi:hypothetical protein
MPDRVLTEPEVQEAGQHGIKQFDKEFLVGYLGMVLATNPPADRLAMFTEIRPQSVLLTALWGAAVTEAVFHAFPRPPGSREVLPPRERYCHLD